MTSDSWDARRASFRSVGDDYERSRPQYPPAAVEWIVDGDPRDILDLGCGPGKLTTQMAALGYRTIGLDPSIRMLESVVVRNLPVICGTAESIPLRPASVDLVTAAQAFHWFDHSRALPEIRRVLRRGGRVGLLWNLRDERVDWVRELSSIIGSEDAMTVPVEPAALEIEAEAKLRASGAFEAVEHIVLAHDQELTPEGLVSLVASRSYVAILPVAERRDLLSDVARLCREHPQLERRATLSLPYRTVVLRARAAD